ncbi:hypothetical protein Nit79A3_2745 [Nitrosomonas sp. Is79A3]|uniref:hypothetical protein n=1 Tax=Nitrosomonas sp. (strain Is79A3) TaxID=261292 RepID=UPI000215D20B
MPKKETNSPVIIEGQVLQALPTPQIKLATIEDCRREMARVYRDARTARIDTQDASRFVYILSQIGKLIETGQLEQRLIELEQRLKK